jgi:hypothetical protein
MVEGGTAPFFRWDPLLSVSDPDPDSIGSADPGLGRPKLSPKNGKNEETSSLKSLDVLCRGLGRHIRQFLIKKCSNF